jgi:poly(3-hydroxyalkanoate) synthetase
MKNADLKSGHLGNVILPPTEGRREDLTTRRAPPDWLRRRGGWWPFVSFVVKSIPSSIPIAARRV